MGAEGLVTESGLRAMAGRVEGAEEVARLLELVLKPDSTKQATERIKSIGSTPDFIHALMAQLVNHPDPGVRQLAAVLLRRRLPKAWGLLDTGAKGEVGVRLSREEIKECLLRRLVEESSHLVRLSVGHAVASLAKLILAEWKARLFSFLSECAGSDNEQLKEMALTVFNSILETRADTLVNFFDDFATIFAKGLQLRKAGGAQPLSVQLAALKGVATLLSAAEKREHLARVRQFIPNILEITRFACVEGKEDVVSFAIEIFSDLAEIGTGDTACDSASSKPTLLPLAELTEITRFMITVIQTNTLDIGIREQASNFIHTVSKNRPKAITKPQDLLNTLVTALLQIALQDESGLEDDEDENDEETTPFSLSINALDGLAINLPSKHFFRVIAPHIGNLLQQVESSGSAAAAARKLGLTVMGVIVEGCEDVMRYHLEELIPPVLSALASPHSPSVKAAAALTLGQMAQFLQPEISSCHQDALSILTTALQDPATQDHKRLHEKLCFAIELFCDQLEKEEVAIHLDVLMSALLHGLTVAAGKRARENCIGAIGSVAQAAEEKFLPYVPQVFSILFEGLSQTRKDLLPLRARSIQSAGSIVQALPKGATVEYHPRLLALILPILKDSYEEDAGGKANAENNASVAQKEGSGGESETPPESRDFSLSTAAFRFLGCLAFSLKDDMASTSLIQVAMEYAVKSLDSYDGIETQYDEQDGEGLYEGDSDGSSDDEDGGYRIKSFKVRTGFLDEQEAAVDLLATLYRNVSGSHMEPHLHKTLQCIQHLQRYLPSVRACLPNLIQAVLINTHHHYLPAWAPRIRLDGQSLAEAAPASAVTSPGSDTMILTTKENRGWIPGLPSQSPLHPRVMELWIEHLWPVFSDMLTSDEDKEIVGSVCSALGELLELMGPSLLQGSTIKGPDASVVMLDSLQQILRTEHPCQCYDDPNCADGEPLGGAGEDESRSSDEALLDGVTSLVSGLAETLGAQFHVPFLRLSEPLLKLATQESSPIYRSVTIGCFGDIFKVMGPSCAPYVDKLLDPVFVGISPSQPDLHLLRNSLYCLSILCENVPSNSQLQSRVDQLLPVVTQIIKQHRDVKTSVNKSMRETAGAVADNATALLGRVIRGFSTILPPEKIGSLVPALLSGLPLVADLEESEGIVKTLIFIYFGGCPAEVLVQHQSDFLRALAGELISDSLTQPTRDQAQGLLAAGIAALGAQNPTVMALAEQGPEYQKLISSLFSRTQS